MTKHNNQPNLLLSPRLQTKPPRSSPSTHLLHPAHPLFSSSSTNPPFTSLSVTISPPTTASTNPFLRPSPSPSLLHQCHLSSTTTNFFHSTAQPTLPTNTTQPLYLPSKTATSPPANHHSLPPLSPPASFPFSSPFANNSLIHRHSSPLPYLLQQFTSPPSSLLRPPPPSPPNPQPARSILRCLSPSFNPQPAHTSSFNTRNHRDTCISASSSSPLLISLHQRHLTRTTTASTHYPSLLLRPSTPPPLLRLITTNSVLLPFSKSRRLLKSSNHHLPNLPPQHSRPTSQKFT